MYRAQGHILVRRRAKNGLDGCIVRTTVWLEGVRYHNDEHLTSGTRYIDIALVWNSKLQKYYRYKCIKTHDASAANKPFGKTYEGHPWGEFWRPVNEESPIYSPLIMADNALLKFAQTNQLLVMKSDNSTVAAGMGGGDFPLWVGAVTPDNAPFRVGIDGKLTAIGADITGTIKTKDGFIGAFKIDGNGLSNISENPTAYINISDRTAQQSNWNGFSVNSDSESFCLIHSISKNAISAVTHLGTALYASGGNFDTAEGYALRTEGNVYMQSDRLGRIELEGTMYLHSGQFGGVELGDNDDSRWIKEVKIKGLSLKYREIALNYQTINSNDDFILFTNKGNINVSLPTDVTPGKIFYLKRCTGYSVTIEGQFVSSNNKQSFENFNMTEASIELIKSKDKWVVFFCG